MIRLKQCLFFLCLTGLGHAGCKQHPASSLQPKQAVISAGEIGSHLPEFSVKDLQGREISSADLRGKGGLVDFWGPWVSAVQERDARLSEAPQLVRLTRICRHRIQVRYHDGYGGPRPICKENRSALSAGRRPRRLETEVWRNRRFANNNAL